MDYENFETQIKELLPKLYDFTVLDNHPLIHHELFVDAPSNQNKGELFRKIVIETINEIRPIDKEYDLNSLEWRPYISLYERYIQGKSHQEIANLLCMSERQLRRIRHQALKTLTNQLWNKFFEKKIPGEISADTKENDLPNFEINREILNLNDLVKGVTHILQNRFIQENIHLSTGFLENEVPIHTDRVISRQILIGVFNFAINLETCHKITVETRFGSNSPELILTAEIDQLSDFSYHRNEEKFHHSGRDWRKLLDIHICENQLTNEPPYKLQILVTFPQAHQKTALIVDDQKPAIRMFERYLSRTTYEVIGQHDAADAVNQVRSLMPTFVILDVMMPAIDGWEVLQALQLNEETRHIPVIVCSAWDEPELAKSLGAVAFLKKPITQKVFLETLEALDLLS
jgi:CheY-like chemotaxis protein